MAAPTDPLLWLSAILSLAVAVLALAAGLWRVNRRLAAIVAKSKADYREVEGGTWL